MLSKRQLLLTGGSGIVLTMARLPPAHAQIPIITVIKFVGNAVGILASSIGIFDELNKWLADKRCSVTIVHLEDAKFRCQMLIQSIVASGTGVQAAFGSLFAMPTDQKAWHAFKLALGEMLVEGVGVMEAFNEIAKELGPDKYPGARSDLETAYHSVDKLRAVVTQLAASSDQPTVDDVNQSKQVVENISALVGKVAKAELSLQAAIDDRRQVSCP